MPTIRDALDRLGRESLTRLTVTRGLAGTRANDDRRSSLARSYRGDAAAFAADLDRAELVSLLQTTWLVDGVELRATRVTNTPKEYLQTLLASLLAGGTLPDTFLPLDPELRRAARAKRTSTADQTDDAADGRPSWIDEALSEKGVLAERYDAVFPSWLVKLDAATTSRDPLGLQALAAANADGILPGLNVFTSRARYYSFLCWSIDVAQQAAKPEVHVDRVHRLERLLVLSEALRHREEPSACSYVGRRRGRAFVREHDDGRGWPLPTRILKNQSSNGALRLYRTSLANLGLIEEDDVDDGLGLTLTDRGQTLAEKYGNGVDPAIVRWALEGTDQRKRADSLAETTDLLCLSGLSDRYERRNLIEALFGRNGTIASPDAMRRRDTARLLHSRGLLVDLSGRPDIAAADADAVSDDGGASAADEETRGNWNVIRAILRAPPSRELDLLQRVCAYELLAMALNRTFAALVEAVDGPGRVPVTEWLQRVEVTAGADYGQKPAREWSAPDDAIDLADRLLGETSWPAIAARSLALLLHVLRSDRLVGWLHDVVIRDVFLMSVLEIRQQLTRTPRELHEALVRDIVVRHREESSRKGKGDWLFLDSNDLVRAEPRPLRAIVHSLRFAQLQQLAADLDLTAEEVADAP